MLSLLTRLNLSMKKATVLPVCGRAGPVLALKIIVLSAFSLIGTTAAVYGYEASLDGSNFEIDDDANLIVDQTDPGPPVPIDWATVDDFKQNDAPSGADDDSFGQGSKEDSEVPTVVDGSIPPNKSDLETFGVYKEENEDGKFLHLFWTRVQDPSGTTNMDFEFNQSDAISANGVTPERTSGDLLIVYELSRGGTVPNLFLFKWFDGSEGVPVSVCESENSWPCWGDRTDLSAAGGATGSINTSAILADDSDGLGDLDPRTFGEASVDLTLIFDPTKCQSFGSAYLKSRSSDSFTAALKDFIAPQAINLTNCATVIIRKQTIPTGLAGNFDFVHTLITDPVSLTDFTLADAQDITFNNVVLGGPYTVTEDDLAEGFVLDSIDCSASSGVTPTIDDETPPHVSFSVDDVDDEVDCTFYNRALGSIVIQKVTEGPPASSQDTFEYTGTLGPFSITTPDTSNTESKTFDNLDLGDYEVTESSPEPAFYFKSLTCTGGDTEVSGATATIHLDAGDNVICTYTNEQAGTIIVEKQTNPDGASGSFTFTGDAAGPIGDGGQIVVNNLRPGTYTSTEADPTSLGFKLESIDCVDTVSGGTSSTGDVGTRTATFKLDPGETVTCTFTNETGAIKITKTAKNASSTFPGPGLPPLNGVSFDVSQGGTLIDTVTTEGDGTACIDYLVPGLSYSVLENPIPTGYAVQSTNPQPVTVSAGATCDSGTPDPVSFVNNPLSEITISFESLAGPAVTKLTSVTCSGPSLPTPVELTSGPFTFSDLLEGDYTCIIKIDP